VLLKTNTKRRTINKATQARKVFIYNSIKFDGIRAKLLRLFSSVDTKSIYLKSYFISFIKSNQLEKSP